MENRKQVLAAMKYLASKKPNKYRLIVDYKRLTVKLDEKRSCTGCLDYCGCPDYETIQEVRYENGN